MCCAQRFIEGISSRCWTLYRPLSTPSAKDLSLKKRADRVHLTRMTQTISMLALLDGLGEPATWRSSDWVAVLLLSLLLIVLGVGAVCLLIVIRLLRSERRSGVFRWRDAANLLTEGRKFQPSMFE